VRRGFKAEAERIASDYRSQLGCAPADPTPLNDLAALIGVQLVPADELVDRGRLQELEKLQPGAFSAGTFNVSGERVIVYNPLHSEGRQRSDQAHELAHLILNHKVRSIERIGDLKLLTCDSAQEEEADWLAGCLLLPRPLLLRAAQRGLSPEQIADRHNTSESMARFRLNASGVLVQLGRSRKMRS
jgi:hypothetical protein